MDQRATKPPYLVPWHLVKRLFCYSLVTGDVVVVFHLSTFQHLPGLSYSSGFAMKWPGWAFGSQVAGKKSSENGGIP